MFVLNSHEVLYPSMKVNCRNDINSAFTLSKTCISNHRLKHKCTKKLEPEDNNVFQQTKKTLTNILAIIFRPSL